MNSGEARAERVEANYQYFVAFAESRASLENLPGMALLTAFMLGLSVGWTGSLALHWGYPELTPLFYAHLALIGFSLLMCVVTLFKGWVFRYQVVASGFSVFFAIVGWVFGSCALATFLATVDFDTRNVAVIAPTRLMVAAIVGPLYVAGATVVHVLLLRKRLREGHSKKRTMGNYLAASSVYSSKSLWIIAAVTIIGPNLLTGGRYALTTFGVLAFLLFASVVTSLPVELGYLTYLKSRDRKYWERTPPKVVVTRERKITVAKKVVKWVLIVVAAVFALALFPMLGQGIRLLVG